jgi:HSP20 family protein
MDWKKIAPWNWFKDEDASSAGPARPARRLAASSDPFLALRSEMDRLFDDVMGHSPSEGARLPAASGHEWARALIRPSVDITEGRKAYKVRVEIPGVEREDVSIEIQAGDRLLIRAEKRLDHEEDGEGYHCVESSYGAFQRILSLPQDADVAANEAKFKNGVLKLTIPKRPVSTSRSQSIEVQTG